MRCDAAAACLLLALGPFGGTEQGGAALDAQRAFKAGLTALHNFEYEDANDAFQKARTIDPAFVMAYWGEALTYYQTLWRHENVEAARQVLSRLGPTKARRLTQTSRPVHAA